MQSREGSYVFAGAFLLSNCVLRDCHVASLLAMTHQGGAVVHQRPPAVEWLCTRRSVTALQAVGFAARIRWRKVNKFVIARPQRGRGNLGKAVSFSPMAFLRSGYDLRDCTPRALPRAARSGRHVGLRPPRNDKLGGLAPLNCCCTTCNCLRRSGSAAAAEPSKYPGMHP